MKGHLIMSAKERKRMQVLDRVQQKQLSLKEAATPLIFLILLITLIGILLVTLALVVSL